MHKLLGGFRDRIPAYIAGGYYEEGKGLKELAEEMEENLNLGARAVKMKIGGAPINEDVERVRVVRETIGPDIKLLVDANNAYAAYEAIEVAHKIEPHEVFWFEEPVAPDDYRGHAQVAQATRIPVATGENEYTRYGFRDLIETGISGYFQRGCTDTWRSHRIHERGGTGRGIRSAHCTARRPGSAHPSGDGHRERADS